MFAWRICAATSLLKFAAKATPTSDIHHTRRRRFNAEKQTFSVALSTPLGLARISHLAPRISLLTTSSREINFTPTLNRRRYACMARLRSNIFYKIHG